MANNKPQLLTLPPRYNNLQQPPQVPKEFAIQLDLLPPRSAPRLRTRSSSSSTLLPDLCLVYGSSFLLGYGIANAAYEGESESYVDCTGDFGAVG